MDDLKQIKSNDLPQLQKWLNSQLELHASDKAIRDLCLRLQVVSEDLDSVVDGHVFSLIKAIPLVQKEIIVLTQETGALKKDLQRISQKVNEVQHKNESVAALSEIDSVKKKVIHCRDILGEVDTWQKRVEFFHEYLKSKDFSQLLEKKTSAVSDQEELEYSAEQFAQELTSMKKKTSLLSVLPEFAERENELLLLENEFTIRLMPQLSKSFEEHNEDLFRACTDTLTIIGREGEIRDEFVQCVLTNLSQQADSYSERNVASLDRWLEEFFDTRRQTLRDELLWIDKVFDSDKEEVMKEMMVKSFEEFRGTFEEWMSEYLKDKGKETNIALKSVLKTYILACEWFHEHPFVDFLNAVPIKCMWNLGTSFIMSLDKFHEYELVAVMSTWEKVRWVEENQKNRLSFQDIFSRITDAIDLVFPDLRLSVERCIDLSGGGRVEQELGVMRQFFDDLFLKFNMLMGRYQGEVSLGDNFLEDQGGWISEMHGAFKLLKAMMLVKDQIDDFWEFLIKRFMDAVTQVCTDDEIRNQTFRSLMDSKLFKNLSNFQQREEYFTYQEKCLSRWNELRQASESFVQAIMLRKIERILNTEWAEPRWAERSKKSRLEKLSFRDPSEYISKIADHIMTVATQLAPQDDANSNEPEFDHYEWTARLVQATSDCILIMISKIKNLSPDGAAQLSTDVEFFANVASSLVSEDDLAPVFEALKFLLTCDAKDETYKDLTEFESENEKRACENIIRIRFEKKKRESLKSDGS